ncbi:hypothetical protein HMPREF9012_2018 [Bacteroidetes bacterium oral taxon 272 str. F0290]|nr:hypothetical protein HMPREF9012_2018 [Bacteroidetes bacterium oral taxon 272 str. F0290]
MKRKDGRKQRKGKEICPSSSSQRRWQGRSVLRRSDSEGI